MSENRWAHLGRLARERRRSLRLTQRDIQNEGGPSEALIRQIESGRYDANMQPAMRRAYERALMWQPGSIDAVLAGEIDDPWIVFYVVEGDEGKRRYPGWPERDPSTNVKEHGWSADALLTLHRRIDALEPAGQIRVSEVVDELLVEEANERRAAAVEADASDLSDTTELREAAHRPGEPAGGSEFDED